MKRQSENKERKKGRKEGRKGKNRIIQSSKGVAATAVAVLGKVGNKRANKRWKERRKTAHTARHRHGIIGRARRGDPRASDTDRHASRPRSQSGTDGWMGDVFINDMVIAAGRRGRRQ